MAQQAKILIVDDDPRLVSLLKFYLTKQGFSVDYAANAEQMDYKLSYAFFDLIILDWMMPGEDGLSICQRLSAQQNPPLILMLTANGSENDCIAGLHGGADDFLAKPFNTDVLLAHIEAILRRRTPSLGANIAHNSFTFEFGPYVLDFTQRCLFVNKDIINLSHNEFALLKLLAQHAGTPVSREFLSHHLKNTNNPRDSRFIDTQIYRLRRIIEKNPANPVYLQTARGVGYLLVSNHSASVNN